MRPVAPRTGAPEHTLGTDQHEFTELTAALYHDPRRNLSLCLTRWRPSAADLERLNAGEDIYVATWLTAGNGLQPFTPTVGPEAWMDNAGAEIAIDNPLRTVRPPTPEPDATGSSEAPAPGRPHPVHSTHVFDPARQVCVYCNRPPERATFPCPAYP